MRDAINARAKRVLKQLFPANHIHVDGISSDNKTPLTQLSLLEYYIRNTKLKSIVRSDLISGDVTGQWCLSIDWSKSTRMITNLVRRNPIVESIDGEDLSELELPDGSDEEEELEDEEITDEGPDIVDFAVEDLAVIPPTCMDLQKAKLVSLKLRLSAEACKDKEDEGVFIISEKYKNLKEFCRSDQRRDKHNRPKKQSNDAGIKTEGINSYAMIYCVYGRLPFDGEKEPESEGIVFFAGQTEIVGIIRNPLWSAKRPILSKPVERKQGSFFGVSKVESVKFLQWQLVDIHNIGQDSALYEVMPVMAADPLNNPTWAAMVMAPGAVWPIAPGGVQKIDFGNVSQVAAERVELMKRQIWESMGINEMMMGAVPKGRKNNQMMAGLQQEQSTEVSDHAANYEEEMLNPLLEMIFEFDQQYRTADLMIETRGEIGYKAKIESIPPQQWGERYFFRWIGIEAMLNMQKVQQMIGFMNVAKSIPPPQLGGKRLDISPILQRICEQSCGVDLTPNILIDERDLYAVPPEIEDEMMFNGMPTSVHESDDDMKHLRSHMAAASRNGDPRGLYKAHMVEHMKSVQKKRQMQQAQQQPKGLPGGPGGMLGGQPQPGTAGTPRPGALPAPQRPAQNPPGAIGGDQMGPGRG